MLPTAEMCGAGTGATALSEADALGLAALDLAAKSSAAACHRMQASDSMQLAVHQG